MLDVASGPMVYVMDEMTPFSDAAVPVLAIATSVRRLTKVNRGQNRWCTNRELCLMLGDFLKCIRFLGGA